MSIRGNDDIKIYRYQENNWKREINKAKPTDISSWFAPQEQFETFMFLIQTAVVQRCVSSLCLFIQIPTDNKNTQQNLLKEWIWTLFIDSTVLGPHWLPQ